MKRLHLLLYILLCFSVCTHAQGKHALLIGISKYPDDSEWWSLSAQNDLELLKPILATQGFRVMTLQDAAATKQNIVRQFENLTQGINPGDTVFIHFSCHGQQMEDDNGDEPDGWDEALIPYDAELVYEKGVYEGENHLRDDEFNLYLQTMQQKAGPNGMIMVSLDACHSASGTRDENKDETFRGTARRFTPSGKSYTKNTSEDNHYVRLLQDKSLAPLMVISACKSYQVNLEIKRNDCFYGPLSYYLAKTLKRMSLTDPTVWMSVVQETVRRATGQHPVIESTWDIKR